MPNHSRFLSKPHRHKLKCKVGVVFDDFVNQIYLPQVRMRKRSWQVDARIVRLYLQAAFGAKTLAAIRREETEKWLESLSASGLAAATCNRILAVFKSICALAEKLGFLNSGASPAPWSGLAILVIAVALGQSATFRFPLALYSILLFAPLMGLGVGLTLASLSRFVPVLSRLVPFLLRMLFLVSGVFFQVSELPSRLSELLLANPVAQLIEYLRYGFSASSAAPSYSIAYIDAWTLLPLCLGLLLERHARGRTGK